MFIDRTYSYEIVELQRHPLLKMLNNQIVAFGMLLVINGLKIVLTFHPLPTLPHQGGGTNYNPLSPGGRGQG